MSAVAEDLVRVATVEKARGYWSTVFRRLSRDPVSMMCATITGSSYSIDGGWTAE